MQNKIAETVSIQVSSQDKNPVFAAFDAFSNIQRQKSLHNYKGLFKLFIPAPLALGADVGNRVTIYFVPTPFLAFLKDTGIPFSIT